MYGYLELLHVTSMSTPEIVCTFKEQSRPFSVTAMSSEYGTSGSSKLSCRLLLPLAASDSPKTRLPCAFSAYSPSCPGTRSKCSAGVLASNNRL